MRKIGLFVLSLAIALLLVAALDAAEAREAKTSAKQKKAEPVEEPALVLLIVKGGKTCVGELVSEDADSVTVREIRSGKEVTEAKDRLSKLEVGISERDAMRYVGLAFLTAWKIGNLATPPAKVIVVPPLDADGNASESSTAFAEALTAALVDRSIPVVDRAVLEKALEDLGLRLSQLTDGAKVLRVAQKVGVSTIVTGRIVPKGRNTEMHIRLVKAESGAVILAVSQQVAASSPAGAGGEKDDADPATPDRVIAEDVHDGSAGGPGVSRGNIYALKIDPAVAKVNVGSTALRFQAWMARDRDSNGDVFVSTDYGATWGKVYSWNTKICKQAKRQGNWFTVHLNRLPAKVRAKPIDEIQVKFAYVSGNDSLEIKKVAWVFRH